MGLAGMVPTDYSFNCLCPCCSLTLHCDDYQMGLLPKDYSFVCLTLGCYCCRLNYLSLYKVFRRQQNYFSKEYISRNRIVLLGSHRKRQRFYKGKYHHHLEEVQIIC